MTENLLSALDKRKKPEDYLSEAFVYVLNRLKKKHPALAANIIYRLSGNEILIPHSLVSRVDIATRCTIGNNLRPDITIKGTKFLLHVEVKRSNPVDPIHLRKQLKGYLADLDKHADILQRRVVLLAHRNLEDLLQNIPNHPLFAQPIYWYEIAECIEGGTNSVVAGATESLMRQFADFLKEEGLAVDKVRPSVLKGAKSLMHLNNHVVKVLRDHGVKPTTLGWVEGTGHKFRWSDIPCEVDYHYEFPEALVFYANIKGSKRLAAKLPNHGWEDVEDEPGWKSKVLSLKEEGFFAAKSSSIQSDLLSGFIDLCLKDLNGRTVL